MTIDFSVEPLAEDALLLRFSDSIEVATNARVHAAARALREAALPGVTDIAPAYASLLLRFDPFAWRTPDGASGTPHARLRAAVYALLSPTRSTFAGKTAPANTIEIPVCYGGDFGPDLEAAAEYAKLSRGEVIARHSAAEYTVAMLGFAPGFPYLLGLDPALHLPRRATPRTRVPAGSVAIGGAQTGIYPRELPGGWNLIGRTPFTLFDPQREPPALVAPGDRVRFRVIERGEFDALAEQAA